MLGLFFPRLCLGCQQGLVPGEQHVCLHCLEGLHRPDLSSLTDNAVARKLWGRLPLNGAVCLWDFAAGSQVQRIIHQMKYNHHPKACRYLGRQLGRLCQSVSPGGAVPWDAVAFVPMHRRKYYQRGYNQAELLAQGVAETLGLPILQAVQKHLHTGSQTRLSRAARWRNVQAAFSLRPKAETLAGKRVLMVDDVLTTGATIEGAAKPLLQAGVHQIGIAVLASVV